MVKVLKSHQILLLLLLVVVVVEVLVVNDVFISVELNYSWAICLP